MIASAPGLSGASRPEKRVTTCYAAFDAFFPRFGLFDMTEGIYDGPDTTYERAQANQHDYLLDQARCGPGSRLLDLGCGYGTLLERARRRGVDGVGITFEVNSTTEMVIVNNGNGFVSINGSVFLTSGTLKPQTEVRVANDWTQTGG